MGSKRLRGGGHGEQEVKGEEVMGSKRLRGGRSWGARG